METLAVGEAERFEAEADLLGDRLRVSVINIATSEGKKAGMEVADPVVGLHRRFGLQDRRYSLRQWFGDSRSPSFQVHAEKKGGRSSNSTAQKHMIAEKKKIELAKDVELFAQHAGRKSIRMEDVTLTAHRNGHLMGLLRTFSQELKGKEPSTERKREIIKEGR